MARIKIEDIRQECQERGWVLLSDSYKNLQTPMKFTCKRGHEVEMTWAEVRKDFKCEKCTELLRFKALGDIANTSKEKDEDKVRVLAFDQAVRVSGFSVFDGEELVDYGTYQSTGSTTEERIIDVCRWIDCLIDKWQPDIIGVEDIMFNPRLGGYKVFRALGQLLGGIVITTHKKGYDLKIVPIATWRRVNEIKGKKREEKKVNAKRTIQKRYGLIASEDEAEAICIGYYFAKEYGGKKWKKC